MNSRAKLWLWGDCKFFFPPLKLNHIEKGKNQILLASEESVRALLRSSPQFQNRCSFVIYWNSSLKAWELSFENFLESLLLFILKITQFWYSLEIPTPLTLVPRGLHKNGIKLLQLSVLSLIDSDAYFMSALHTSPSIIRVLVYETTGHISHFYPSDLDRPS